MLPSEGIGCPFTSRYCSVPGASVELLRTGPDVHVNDLAWQASGKSDQKRISILDLPRELRDRIFNYAFANEGNIRLGVVTLASTHPHHWHPESTLKRFLPATSRLDLSSRSPDMEDASCTGLLATCRQIHHEAATVLYGNNAFESHIHLDAQWKASFEQDTPFPDIVSAYDMLPFAARYRSLVQSVVFRPYLIGSRDGFKVLQTFQTACRNIPRSFAGYRLRPEGLPDCHDIGLFAYDDRRGGYCRDVYAGWDRRGTPSVLAPMANGQCQKRRKSSATKEIYLRRKSNLNTPVPSKSPTPRTNIVTFRMKRETMLKLSAALMHTHGVPGLQSIEMPTGEETVNVHFTTSRPMALKLVLAQITGEDKEGFSYWKIGPEVLGITTFSDDDVRGSKAGWWRGGAVMPSYGYFRNKLDRAWTMWYWALKEDPDGFVRRRADACAV